MSYCDWADINERNKTYHDTEWGIPVHDDRHMFEHLTLECLQCGLSWDLMLKKREILLYKGHGKRRHPVSNGLSARISKDLKKRGFKYIGPVTIYSHLQACGIINDHDEDCPCGRRINENNLTVIMKI